MASTYEKKQKEKPKSFNQSIQYLFIYLFFCLRSRSQYIYKVYTREPNRGIKNAKEIFKV